MYHTKHIIHLQISTGVHVMFVGHAWCDSGIKWFDAGLKDIETRVFDIANDVIEIQQRVIQIILVTGSCFYDLIFICLG